jgi:hypothetical protein
MWYEPTSRICCISCPWSVSSRYTSFHNRTDLLRWFTEHSERAISRRNVAAVHTPATRKPTSAIVMRQLQQCGRRRGTARLPNPHIRAFGGLSWLFAASFTTAPSFTTPLPHFVLRTSSTPNKRNQSRLSLSRLISTITRSYRVATTIEDTLTAAADLRGGLLAQP